ncbi:unnamed protein product [Chilo suppressalis]|uniref:Tetraspanin n=1 Tax=Chilo suppressalis TaxID=168631 RepID=A0ABN8BH28_CHISP|nr:unnamed protein product [Chilo suppressalis]
MIKGTMVNNGGVRSRGRHRARMLMIPGRPLRQSKGLPDVRPILPAPAYRWEDMGNSNATSNKEKGPEAVIEDDASKTEVDVTRVDHQKSSFVRVEKVKERLRGKIQCCSWCPEVCFVIFCVLTLLKGIGEIFISISGAISTRLFSTEQSGQLVGMVLLALLAAVTVSILIYALLAVFRKQAKPLHAAALVLLITAVLQAVIVGVAVRITHRDQKVLEQSVQESFNLALQENPRHTQLWAAIQNDLTCCGLNSPYDYRALNLPDVFPPNVPIACCPTYDPSRSDLVQERDRERCKLRRTYYGGGCREAIYDVVKTTSDVVLALTISLIVFEVIMSVLSAILHVKIKRHKAEKKEKTKIDQA